MMEDIRAEKEQLAELELELGQKFMGEDDDDDRVDVSDIVQDKTSLGKGNPNPVRPDPDVQAEKRSNSALGDMLDG